MSERWRPIPGYPDYEASNRGRIRSLPRLRPHNRNKTLLMQWPGKVLKPGLTGPGRPFVVIRKRNMFVHRLVAMAWLGPAPFAGALVRHLDDNKLNNIPSNLRWGTQKQNLADAKRNGAILGGFRPKGSRCRAPGVFL